MVKKPVIPQKVNKPVVNLKNMPVYRKGLAPKPNLLSKPQPKNYLMKPDIQKKLIDLSKNQDKPVRVAPIIKSAPISNNKLINKAGAVNANLAQKVKPVVNLFAKNNNNKNIKPGEKYQGPKIVNIKR